MNRLIDRKKNTIQLSPEVSYAHIFKIAFPVILGQLAQNVISLADTMFLGHVGETQLAAGALAAIFYQVAVMFMTGFGIGTQILIAHRMGEGLPRSVGRFFFHAVCFMLVAALSVFLLFKGFGSLMLTGMIRTPEVRAAVDEYLQWRVYGLPFAFVSICFNAFYVGTARTRTISVATLTMGGVNVLLDYLLVFGVGPFPELGMRGAALASVVAEAVGMGVYIVVSLVNRDNRDRFRLFSPFPLRGFVFGKMLHMAYPIMLEYLISFGNYFIFFLMIERLGQHPLAVANITRSLYTIFLLPTWGYTATVSSLTAFLCGRKRPEEIGLLVRRCMLLGVVSVSVLILPYLPLHDLVLSCFTGDAGLRAEAFRPSLVAIAATYLMVWAQMIFNSILGRGKTGAGFAIELVTMAIYMGYSAYTILYRRASVAWAFTTEWVYIVMLGLLSLAYLRWMRRPTHHKKYRMF